jgi:peptidylprolyl isomerase
MTRTRSHLVVVVFVMLAIFGAGCMTKDDQKGTDTAGGTKVLLETNMGEITIELRDDMPITAGNFKKLVNDGFYNGVIFHRVIDGFMIQGGDPTGTGRGGPGYAIKDEFTSQNRNDRGTISMANAGPNTGGSQFFINLVDNNYLDKMHPVFGEVVTGMDVVDSISKVKTGPMDRPLKDVVIVKAKVYPEPVIPF